MSLAAVIQFPTKRPPGRPSNASLRLEVVTLRNALEVVTEERDDLDVELHAFVSERLAFASETLALSRRGQTVLAAGYRPTQQLLDIERGAHRELARALAMRQPDDAA